MGVDYYNCDNCNEIYADCSNYGSCIVCNADVCYGCSIEIMSEYCFKDHYHREICDKHFDTSTKYLDVVINYKCIEFSIDELLKMKCIDCDTCDNCKVCCGCSVPNKNLIRACTKGNVEMLMESIKEGATLMNNGFLLACQYGHVNIVNELKKDHVSDITPGIKKAFEYRSIDIIKNLMNKDNANSYIKTMFNEYRSDSKFLDSDFEIYKIFKSYGTIDMSFFLVAACKVDDHLLVSKILEDTEFSKDEYEEALSVACKRSKSKCVELLIDKASNYNECMLFACSSDNELLVLRLISLGANNFNECMHMCTYNEKIGKILQKHGASRKHLNKLKN